jgi:hypothetical protein
MLIDRKYRLYIHKYFAIFLIYLAFAGCAAREDNTGKYRETYIGVCEDLDAAAADMETVIRGAAEPSPDWETLEGVAESVYRVFSSCRARMSAARVPDEYAESYAEFMKALDEGCRAAATMSEAVKARDRAAVKEAAADFEKAGRLARAATELTASLN